MNKQTKNEAKMEKDVEKKDSNSAEIERLGKGIKSNLEAYFRQWNRGLPFRDVISRYSTKAKSLGLSVDELADVLEAEGFVKIYRTPNNKRFVFSADCGMSETEINDLMHEIEAERETERELRKASRA